MLSLTCWWRWKCLMSLFADSLSLSESFCFIIEEAWSISLLILWSCQSCKRNAECNEKTSMSNLWCTEKDWHWILQASQNMMLRWRVHKLILMQMREVKKTRIVRMSQMTCIKLYIRSSAQITIYFFLEMKKIQWDLLLQFSLSQMIF